MIRVNKVASVPSLSGLREIEEKDILQVSLLYTKYMQRFQLAPLFDVDEVRHQFTSGKGTGEMGDAGPGRRPGQVTWTYVVEVEFLFRLNNVF